jgi:hypothetical protein
MKSYIFAASGFPIINDGLGGAAICQASVCKLMIQFPSCLPYILFEISEISLVPTSNRTLMVRAVPRKDLAYATGTKVRIICL